MPNTIFIKEAEIIENDDIKDLFKLTKSICRILLVTEKDFSDLLSKLLEDLKIIDDPNCFNIISRFYLVKRDGSYFLQISIEVNSVTKDKGVKKLSINPEDVAKNTPEIGYKTKAKYEVPISSEFKINESLVLKILQGLTEEQVPYAQLIAQRNKDLIKTVSELKANQDALYQANSALKSVAKKLAEKNQELNDFTHVVSHDLKGPLSNLNGVLEMLHIKSSKAGINLESSLNIARNEIAKMRLFIERVLEFSISGIEKRKFEEINLEEFLENFCRDHVYSRTVKYRIDCPVAVRYPPEELQIILNNLIGNAVKYNTNEVVNISITQSRDHSNHISVADNGIGIETEHLGKVFNFGSILSNLGANQSSGVGLALIKRLIEKYHGGKIWVDSIPGQGSVFHFLLGEEKKPHISAGL